MYETVRMLEEKAWNHTSTSHVSKATYFSSLNSGYNLCYWNFEEKSCKKGIFMASPKSEKNTWYYKMVLPFESSEVLYC